MKRWASQNKDPSILNLAYTTYSRSNHEKDLLELNKERSHMS